MSQQNLMKFQHCSFLNVENPPIKTISVKSVVEDGMLCVAIARTDGSVDIWKYMDANETWYECLSMAGSESILYLSMVWIGPKTLLLGGTSSDMCLVNFQRKISKKYINCGGSGCVWCMSVHPKGHLLAVGADDASVILFDISDENVFFKRVVDKCLGKVLCIDWHPTDEVFACATDNSRIYVFDAIKNVCLNTMNADRILGVSATIWSILLLKDMTIVIGDSFGKVQFYDGKYGTLINNFQSHQASILTLTSDKNNSSANNIYASGVDNKIVSFHPTKDNKWSQGFEYRCHLNDIVKVEFAKENILLSASVDGSCQMYHLDVDNVTKLCSFGLFPEHQKVTITNTYIAYYQFSTIHLYLHHDSYPQKLLELKLQGDDHIQDLFITNKGDFLCCSTTNDVRCYSLELTNDNTLNITNVDSLPNIKPFISHTIYNDTNCHANKAILLHCTKKYLKLQIINFDTQHYEIYKLDNFLIDGPYSKIQCCLSPNDKVLGILAPFNYDHIPPTYNRYYFNMNINSRSYSHISLYSTDTFELLETLNPQNTMVSSFVLTNKLLVCSSPSEQIFKYQYNVGPDGMILHSCHFLINIPKNALITQVFIENNSDNVVCVTRHCACKIVDFLKFGNHPLLARPVKDIPFKNSLLMVKQLENNSYVTIVRCLGDIIQEQSPAFKRKRFGLA